MDAVQQLLELEALKRLKASYFRFYDTQDWDNWLALFTEDGTLTAEYHTIWHDGPRQEPLMLAGRKAIGDHLVPLAPLRKTVHHGHTPEIDIVSETEARGIWAMEDIVEYADRRLHGHGHYHETYRKEDGRWRFASVHLKRLRVSWTEADLRG